MSQENVDLARAALNAFAELDEGLVDPEGLSEFFAKDVIATFSGFLEEQTTLHGRDDSLSSALPGWSPTTISSTSR